jgi:hypothetical protein
METLFFVVILFIVLDVTALRWGFDSTEKIDSPEWERRATRYAHFANPDPGERKQTPHWR